MGKRSSALPKLKILPRYPPVTMRHNWQLGWMNTSTGYIPFDLNDDRKTQCTLAQILTFDDARNCFFFLIFKCIFEVNEVLLGLAICPRHRERFGIRWRSCKKNCSCPSEVSVRYLGPICSNLCARPDSRELQ